MMKIAIMQPYFFPYIGYFQLMNAVDEFVVYDNIEYSRKGWVNRNRVLVGGSDAYITLPLKKDSDYLNIVERSLAESWPVEREKILNRLKELYRAAPSYKQVFPMLEECLRMEEANLFEFLMKCLLRVKQYLEISTPLITSSTLPIVHNLKAEEKVLAIVKARNADTYINPIGGLELYSKSRFKSEGIELLFLKADNITYQQFNNQFVPFLSIIDVLMFNSQPRVKEYLAHFTLN
jgi:hypothetical protein